MKKVILSLFISALAFQNAEAQWWQSSKQIDGNGKMTSSNRTVSNYDKVSLTGSMDVELIKGREGNLRIEAEENLIEYITTEVNGDELEISVKRGYNLDPSNNRSIKIIVPYEDIDGVSLTGSGDIFTSEIISSEDFVSKITGSGDVKLGLKAKNVKASITGSGDMVLRGSAEEFDCKVTGSGDISAYDFKCQRVDATITGSGDIEVYATEELRANLPGAGDIKYKGNPRKEDFRTSGVGSISKQ